ncbi:GL19730 [Drosophila persimilis]|uniref:GL19730 n=1 Tax=Drosophila persimilis TaxID=7234 RepID=B4HB22_DROPE|nr:GL19730 [Drosophila persimilis]
MLGRDGRSDSHPSSGSRSAPAADRAAAPAPMAAPPSDVGMPAPCQPSMLPQTTANLSKLTICEGFDEPLSKCKIWNPLQ